MTEIFDCIVKWGWHSFLTEITALDLKGKGKSGVVEVSYSSLVRYEENISSVQNASQVATLKSVVIYVLGVGFEVASDAQDSFLEYST